QATRTKLRASSAMRDVAAACQKLRAKGARTVVATLGARGAVVVTEEGASAIPAFKAKVVDTTGAGDCFVGALAVRLALGAAPLEGRAMPAPQPPVPSSGWARHLPCRPRQTLRHAWQGPKSPCMVEELFRQDAYLKEAEATVTALEER